MKLVGYVKKDSLIHRLDARVKIAISIIISLLALLFNHPLIMIGLFFSLVLLSIVAKVRKEFIARTLPMTPVAISSFILWTLFFRFSNLESAQGLLFHYGPIIIDRISILYAIAMSFRVLTVLGVPLLFFATTTFSALSLALVKLKMPYTAAFVISLSLRFIDYGLEEMNVIRDAQVSRGLRLRTRSMIERPQNLIALLKPLMEKFMAFQQYLAISMDLRAFGAMPTRTFYIELKMQKQDYFILVTTSAIFLVCLYLKMRGLGTIT